MDEHIEISLSRVEECIQDIRSDEFTTADVIKGYFGRFCSNVGTPVEYSFNAQFGKLLARNASRLGIEEISPPQRVTDEHGIQTTAALWRVRADKLG